MLKNISEIQKQPNNNNFYNRGYKENNWQSRMFDEVDLRCGLNREQFQNLRQMNMISERRFNKIMKKNNIQAAELKAYIYFFFDKFGNKVKDVKLQKADLKKMYKILNIKG